ncbi:unnamed protein product [Rotaria magnacalcarata]
MSSHNRKCVAIIGEGVSGIVTTVNMFRVGIQPTIFEKASNIDKTSYEQYDFVIVASGFFDCPYVPKEIENLSSFPGTLMHSSAYRSPEQQSSCLTDVNDEDPAVVAISDMYAEWNRAVPPFNERPDWIFLLILNNGVSIKTTVDDILILCTGYRPCLEFFSKDILKQLSYLHDDVFCPIILHRNIFHTNLPNLAFIGMYRGPFWAIIELQSRWVASVFAGLLPAPLVVIQNAGLDMERRIREQQPRPQFPHNDYVGSINDLVKETTMNTSSDKNDIAIPAKYRTDGPDEKILDEVNATCQQADQGHFIAGAVFRALHQSQWTFERTLKGKPSDGFASGQAQFYFSKQKELLYKEQGNLNLPSQIPLDVTQKYIYAYDTDNDLLSVYFVDNNNERGSLFHTISFQSKHSSDDGWIANGQHLCSQDHYSASYLFVFNGINLSRFEIEYIVEGPAKDYTSKTIFQPLKNNANF